MSTHSLAVPFALAVLVVVVVVVVVDVADGLTPAAFSLRIRFLINFRSSYVWLPS